MFIKDSSSEEEYQENITRQNGAAEDDDDIDDADDNDSEDDVLKSNLSWKDNLAVKAKNAYLERQSNTHNLMKLVYGVFSQVKTIYMQLCVALI